MEKLKKNECFAKEKKEKQRGNFHVSQEINLTLMPPRILDPLRWRFLKMLTFIAQMTATPSPGFEVFGR